MIAVNQSQFVLFFSFQKLDTDENRVSNALSPTLTRIVEQIFDHIDQLKEDIEELKFPRGNKHNPARTCKDIYLGHSNFTNGNFDS